MRRRRRWRLNRAARPRSPASGTDDGPRALTATLTLPSSRRVRLTADRASAPGGSGSHAALARFDAGTVRLDERGETVRVDDLAVDDFQALRAFLTARGHLSEPLVNRRCPNCDETISVRPSASVEFGPYLDGELDHDDLDAPLVYGEDVQVHGVGVRSSEGSTLRLRPVTVADARLVFAAAAGGADVEPTTAIVAALGLARLNDETDPGRIARVLRQAPPDAWGDVISLVNDAWYPERLRAWVLCESCDAGLDVEAPSEREFPPDLEPPAPVEPFEPFEAFSARVELLAEPILRRRGERVGLIVEPGPAACDDGGVTLLGSYDPPLTEDHAVIGHGPEVRLYYRTFRAQHADEPFDVDAEIIDTIEHELDHHVAWRRGDDPVDDEERAAIVDEARVRIGDTESLRRASRAARGGLLEFGQRTWVLWAVLAVIGWLAATSR